MSVGRNEMVEEIKQYRQKS